MEDEIDMSSKRFCVSEALPSSFYISSTQLMVLPNDVLASISALIPCKWYLRQLNKRFHSLIAPPTKNEFKEIATEVMEKHKKHELSTFDVYLCKLFNLPQFLYQDVQFLSESTIIRAWQLFPAFKKVMWLSLLIENNHNSNLPAPLKRPDLDPRKNIFFHFQVVASLKILNIKREGSIRAIKRIIFDVTEMSEFAEKAKFDREEKTFTISLQVQGNLIEVKDKDKKQANLNFRLKLFQYIIQHLDNIEEISKELQSSKQYKNYVNILMKRVGWNYHHPYFYLKGICKFGEDVPVYTFTEVDSQKWIARVTYVNDLFTIESEVRNSKTAAMQRAAQLFIQRFVSLKEIIRRK